MMTKERDSKKLNKEQLLAVKHKKGPLLIIAGAGTGKTTVITERIKYLIEEDIAKPSEILALTFTEKAAREMEERVDIAVPYGYTNMWISTFHAFCDRVLRAEALHIGLDPRFKLMTEAESIQFIRSNLFEFDLDYFRPLGNPNKFVGGMLKHFSRLQDEDVVPSEYAVFVKKIKNKKRSEEDGQEIIKWEELSSAYRKYDELKVKDGVMDFGDLIVKTLKLFRERKNVLKTYQSQFKVVLVDEFQDTNYAQNELAMLIAGKKSGANITVTGDDDQSIYRFRGAAVSNIIQFRKNYPKAKIVVLTKNYRSTQTILDRAYQLIQHNNPDRLEVVEKINKKLTSQKKKKTENDVVFIHKDRVENETEAVADEIQKLVKKKAYDYKDFAILVRANNHSEPFTRALQRKGLPYQFLGPGRLFKQPEIIDLISYLKVLYNFEDSVSLFRLLSIDYFKVEAKDLARMGNYARRYNLTLYGVCEKIDDLYVINKTKKSVSLILKIVEKHLKLVRKETAGQLLYLFLEETGLIQELIHPDTPEVEKKVVNISKFFDKLKSYEVNHEDATVSAVVDWIELSYDLGESPLAADTDWTDVNAVNLLTVHSAKGLEFPVVFLVNLVSQRFPTIERREQIPIPDKLIKEILPKGDFHEQEERRLFYVGMTRAKEKLYFTAANYYGEGKREKRLSPFIFESLGDGAMASEMPKDDGKQLSFLDYKVSTEKKLKNKTVKGIHLDYLSYSQISTFSICPLHYKLRYILKVPVVPSAALSFGSSIHSAMKDFYTLVKKGERPTKKLITDALSDSWEKEGYTTKSHEEKYFQRGKDYLKQYLKNEFNPKVTPEVIEQSFVVPLPFKSNEKRLKIGGKIDRVDTFSDGSIEVIDYKTSVKLPTQKDIDNDLQLTFYALAAASIREEPFGKNPEDINLSLYFFEGQQKLTTKRTKEQLINAIDEIFEWRKKIENSDFRCSGNYLCNNCEYKMICNADFG